MAVEVASGEGGGSTGPLLQTGSDESSHDRSVAHGQGVASGSKKVVGQRTPARVARGGSLD